MQPPWSQPWKTVVKSLNTRKLTQHNVVPLHCQVGEAHAQKHVLGCKLFIVGTFITCNLAGVLLLSWIMLWCAIPLQYLEANWHHTRPLVQDQGSFSWYRFLCLDVCSQTQWGWKCLHRKMSLYFPEYCPWMNFPLSGEQWHLSLLPVKHRNNRPILNIRCRHGLRFQLQGYQIIHRITLPALLPPCSFRVHNAAWSLSEVFRPVNEHKKREQAYIFRPVTLRHKR